MPMICLAAISLVVFSSSLKAQEQCSLEKLKSRVTEAYNEGLKKGRAEGRAEGWAEGRLVGLRESWPSQRGMPISGGYGRGYIRLPENFTQPGIFGIPGSKFQGGYPGPVMTPPMQ